MSTSHAFYNPRGALLDGRIALVTGSSRGLGRAIALAYASEGADVAVNYLRNEEMAEAVVKQIRGLGRRSSAFGADVSKKEDVDRMAKSILDEFGRVDILVNNAGTNIIGPSEDYSEDDWDKVLDMDLKGVFLCSQAFGRIMIKQKNGCIINISSLLGITGFPVRLAYAAAKHGVIGITKVLACEWGRHGVRVNAIVPGLIKTDLLNELVWKGFVNETDFIKATPLGRLGIPEDIANAAVYLAADVSRYVSGETLVVDGGFLAYGYPSSMS